jgi:hypothetical protein
MTNQSCDVSYQGALNAATVELDKLFEEAKRLQSRIDQVDGAIAALKQLLGTQSEPGWANHQHDSALSIA